MLNKIVFLGIAHSYRIVCQTNDSILKPIVGDNKKTPHYMVTCRYGCQV